MKDRAAIAGGAGRAGAAANGESGWALDRHELVPVASVERARSLDLVGLADRVERAGLSALSGGPVRWAACPIPRDRDVLAYARHRPRSCGAFPAPACHRGSGTGAGDGRGEVVARYGLLNLNE